LEDLGLDVAGLDDAGLADFFAGKTYSPSQVSAFILQKMKETAEAHLGQKVNQAGGKPSADAETRPRRVKAD